ncbi:unnamed protein product [Arctogadus glacialis]
MEQQGQPGNPAGKDTGAILSNGYGAAPQAGRESRDVTTVFPSNSTLRRAYSTADYTTSLRLLDLSGSCPPLKTAILRWIQEKPSSPVPPLDGERVEVLSKGFNKLGTCRAKALLPSVVV